MSASCVARGADVRLPGVSPSIDNVAHQRRRLKQPLGAHSYNTFRGSLVRDVYADVFDARRVIFLRSPSGRY